IVAIDLQNLYTTRLKELRHDADVLTVRRKNFATLQLKGIKPTVFWNRQRVLWNLDFVADKAFGIRNRINSPKLRHTASMLPAKELDLCLTLGTPLGSKQYHPPPFFKESVVLEQLLDSNFALQSLGFCDPSDGYVGGFRLTDEALLQDLQRKPFFQFHA